MLNEKKHLKELVLEWGDTTDDTQNEREVLANLQPHTNLMRLIIKNYGGTRFPNWLGDECFSNIVSVYLEKYDNCYLLPPLGQLPSLKDLYIARMKGIHGVGLGFYGVITSAKPFQCLETLRFEEMSEWEEWRMAGAGEFCKLRELRVIKCPKLKGSLPQDIPSWGKLEIEECPSLTASLPKTSSTGGSELALRQCDGVELGLECWSSLVKLEMSNMLNLEELTSVQCSLTNLQELTIINCTRLLSFPNAGQVPSLKSLLIIDCPKLVFPLSAEMEHCHTSPLQLSLINSCGPLKSLPVGSFAELQSLYIRGCENLETLSILPMHGLQILEVIACENLETLCVLNLASLCYVRIDSCPNMVSFRQGGFPALNLTELEIMNCGRLKSLSKQMHILLPSLISLKICSCPEMESFPEMGLPAKLSSLTISDYKKLVAARSKWDIFHLISLKKFTISGKNEGGGVLEESFPDEGLLPSTLTHLCIEDMPNLKSLNYSGFQLLSSLETLEIRKCPQLKSLPKEGLPTSISSLQITNCPLLKPRCQRDEGDDLKKIAHIPFVKIDNEAIIL